VSYLVDFYSPDPAVKCRIIDQIRQSCLYNGFFQIKNHTVPLEQQSAVLSSAKKFFCLDLEEKQKVSKNNNTWNRGYEMLRSQILEEGTQPDLKEGFYIGDDISIDHPYLSTRSSTVGQTNGRSLSGIHFRNRLWLTTSQR
jgi:isopenicillin N synthase-like dioxygenase